MVRSLSAAMLAACVAPSALGSLVTNGDFEVPVITAPFRVVPAGDSFITGWTVEAPNPNQGVDLVNAPANGNLDYAHTGNQSIDMAGTPGRGSIYQDIATPNLNTYYEISFWVSCNGGGNVDGLSVYFDNQIVSIVDAPSLGTWTQYTFQTKTTGVVTRLKFVGNIDGNSGGTLLDTVSVVEVPAPGALALLGIGGVAGLRRRR